MWLQSRDPATLEGLADEGVHTGYLCFVSRQPAVQRYSAYLKRWRAAGPMAVAFCSVAAA